MSLLAGSVDAGTNYRVRARIRTGTPLEAKGDYRERVVGSNLLQKWNVEVKFGAPNTSYEVQLNGNPIGLVVTNSLGHAEQEFRTTVIDDNPTDGDPPIPQDFPHVNIGDTLTVVGIGTATFR
jgi:hypothetical protein